MVVYPERDWKLVRFEKANDGVKKIKAILEHKKDGRRVALKFGQKGSSTYKDATGVGGDPVHNDKKRRENYRARHRQPGPKYSPSYFSWWYLW